MPISNVHLLFISGYIKGGDTPILKKWPTEKYAGQQKNYSKAIHIEKSLIYGGNIADLV